MIFIEILLFLLFWGFIIFPFGAFVLNFLKIVLTPGRYLIMSTVIGICFISLSAFILRIIHLGNLTYTVILIPLFYFLLSRKYKFIFESIKVLTIDKIFILLLVFSTFCLSYISYFSGDVINGKLRIIGGHAHDSLWHIALINNIQNTNSLPENPNYSDLIVYNYHYFTDIFIAITSSLTSINTLSLYFKIIPIFFALLFISMIYIITRELVVSKLFSYLSMLIVPIASNLYYLMFLLYPGAQSNPSILWIEEYATRMVNLQLLLSYSVVLTLLFLILKIDKTFGVKQILIFSLLTVSLFAIKSYGFVNFCFALLTLLIFKRSVRFLKLFIGIVIVFISFNLIYPLSKESILFFKPFWFIQTMFESSGNLNNSAWELRRRIFLEHNNYARLFLLYLEGLMVFILGNLGLRIIGLVSIFLHNKNKEIIYLLFFISSVGLLLPILFLQRGIVWNSIQFSYYSVITLSILSIVVIEKIYLRFKPLGLVLILIFWLSLLPGVFYTIKTYYPRSDIGRDNDYLNAAVYLKEQPKGIVLLEPIYTEDAFVSALSEKTAYYSDKTILAILLIDSSKREKEVESFFGIGQMDFKNHFLQDNSIKYIFSSKTNPLDESKLGVEEIYNNEKIIIYEVI